MTVPKTRNCDTGALVKPEDIILRGAAAEEAEEQVQRGQRWDQQRT